MKSRDCALPLIPAMVLLVPLVVASSAWTPPVVRQRPATGRIAGTVVMSRNLTMHRPRFRIYAGDGAAALPPEQPAADERSNVVVFIGPPPGVALGGHGDTPVPTVRAAMRQAGEQFVPHVLPVIRGTEIAFPNDDDVFHNVFSLSSARAFDLGRYPRGSSKSVSFDRAGIVQVFCHIHADMSAVVLVLDNPFFTRPDSTGRFVLEGIPAGEYTIVGWHERVRPISHTVRVEPGRTATIDFDIPLPPVPRDAGER